MKKTKKLSWEEANEAIRQIHRDHDNKLLVDLCREAADKGAKEALEVMNDSFSDEGSIKAHGYPIGIKIQ
ncbi:MAG: hypothetical protein CVU12_01415 [Bacteroidetes bacterium HGW-Bacteroidetes-7]|jgi:hypothetical protein|nr:MAG: hypothetical protein CVU12_01415 [Bacteroidetes bacterium HGW-Bacteroidetes-7]